MKIQLLKGHDNYLLFTSFQYYTVPVLFATTFYLNLVYQLPFIAVWIVYALIPWLDELLSLDLRNPTLEEQKKLENEFRFKIPIYICLVMDWFNVYYLLSTLCNNEVGLIHTIIYLFLTANMGASNINISHELIHKDNFLDKFLGTVTLARNMYLHWGIEHVLGHHKNVATPKDPATSKRGQTLYEYLPQTIIGTFKSAWNIECRQMKMRYGKAYVIQNRMLWYLVAYIIIPLLTYKYYGFKGMIYFLITAFTSALYLEIINYVEHYGLVRKLQANGEYEPVNITHSWNAPHRLSNYLLFKLQRHSDHHENPYKPYQILCSYDDSPCLPHGYTVCVLMALFPSLWFDIMDRQIDNWKKYGKNVQCEENTKKIKAFITIVGSFVSLMMIGSIYI